jgi:hypothetical protein
VSQSYEIGYVGRSVCEVIGIDDDAHELEIPAGSLWMVVAISHEDKERPEDLRHSLALLKEGGRRDPRNVGYDGAWYGFLEPEPGVIDWPRFCSILAIPRAGKSLSGTTTASSSSRP